MTFKNTRWKDFELDGSDGSRDCSFFPKNVSQQIANWIVIANSSMVIQESALRLLFEGNITGMTTIEEQFLTELSEVRCSQLKILANSTHGKLAKGECLAYVRVPGYKWVPKTDDDC